MSPVALKDVPTYIATIENFRTLAQKTQQELLQPSVGREAYNLRFDDTYGSIEKRKNRALYGSMATLGTSQILGAYRYYKNTTNLKKQIVAYSTSLKVGNDSTGGFSNIATITAGALWTWLTYKDLCYGFNGVDSNQVYTGANVCDTMGVPVPSAPTMTKADTGLTGNYYYKVSYEIDDYQEGDASVSSAVIAPSNEAVTVTVPLGTFAVAANYRVTKRILYRTEANGSIFYRHVAGTTALADTTTATYVDTTADGSLDTTITAPTDYGAPASYRLSCLHKSRFFLARNTDNKSRVIYCDIRSGIAYPDVYPALNYFDVLKDNGEEITFIGEDNYGQLIVMKPSAVVKINTDTDDPVGWSGFNFNLSVTGNVAPYSAVKTPLGIIFLSRWAESNKRLTLWSGSSIQPIFEELEPILSAIADTDLNTIVAIYHNGHYKLAYRDSSSTYNNLVLNINIFTNSWVIDHKNISCFSSWMASNDWGELYSGSSDTTGILYREETDAVTFQDVIHRYKSDLDSGTVDDACVTAGTEAAPTLILVEAELETQVGADIVSTLTSGTVSDYANLDDNETVSPSCTYLSPVLEINAKDLKYIYWTEVLGTGGRVRFWIRTGDTEVAIAAASWSGPYTASGADISAVTAAKYIQYRCKMYVEDTGEYAGTYLMRSTLEFPDDYVVKITFGYGTPAETLIPMEYIGHWDDFGWINPQFKRVRKRMRAMRIEFERTASGVLTFGYYKDYGSRTDISLNFGDTDPKTGRTYLAQGYWNYNFPLGVYFNKWRHRLYNNDDDALLIKRISFTLSPEPYLPIL